jgi:DNA-binding PadR family transcriptional regulator
MDEHLPLTEATFFILLSLAPSAKHGYAIMQDVAHLSDGRIELGTGTLYGALKRLLEQAWIVRVETAEQDPDTGRPRKDYALTDLGRRILSAETARLQAVASVAQRRLYGGNA